jgi:hypothetical protein
LWIYLERFQYELEMAAIEGFDRHPLQLGTFPGNDFHIPLATPNAFAITWISSSFAAPSTGADCSLIRSAPLRVPAMPALLARGTTRTVTWIDDF